MKRVFGILALMMVAGVVLVAPAAASGATTPTTEPTATAEATPTATATSSPQVTATPSTQVPTTKRPTKAPQDCQAYLYTGTKQNLCDRFPGKRDKVNCKDVKWRVTLVNPKVDPWGLDGSGSRIGTVGVGCESNPLKPVAKPSSSPSPTPVAGEQLPTTGNPTLLVALFGAVLILAGVIGIVLSRRRRVRIEAP